MPTGWKQCHTGTEPAFLGATSLSQETPLAQGPPVWESGFQSHHACSTWPQSPPAGPKPQPAEPCTTQQLLFPAARLWGALPCSCMWPIRGKENRSKEQSGGRVGTAGGEGLAGGRRGQRPHECAVHRGSGTVCVFSRSDWEVGLPLTEVGWAESEQGRAGGVRAQV